MSVIKKSLIVIHLFGFLFVFVAKVHSQKYSFGIRIDPYNLALSGAPIEEKGLGYYEIKKNNSYNNSFSFVISKNTKTSLKWSLGLIFENFNNSFRLQAFEPIDETILYYDESRFTRSLAIGLSLAISYNIIPRLRLEHSFSYSEPVSNHNNLSSFVGPLTLFLDIESMKLRSIQVAEQEGLHGEFIFVNNALHLKISSKLELSLNSRIRPFESYAIHSFFVYGDVESIPGSEELVLNETSLLNNVIFLGIGMNWNFL